MSQKATVNELVRPMDKKAWEGTILTGFLLMPRYSNSKYTGIHEPLLSPVRLFEKWSQSDCKIQIYVSGRSCLF